MVIRENTKVIDLLVYGDYDKNTLATQKSMI